MGLLWAGYNVKHSVNGVAYAAARLEIHGTVIDLDVTNTEGFAGNPLNSVVAYGYAARIPGIGEVEWRITSATFDSLANPFVGPYSILLGAYLNLRTWLNTRSGVSYQSAGAMVTELGSSVDVKGLQPVTYVAKSDGLFLLPIA